VWSPGWLDVFQRVQIRRKETFDSSATPKIGAVCREPKTLAPVDLERLRTRLAGVMACTDTEDPRELRRRIAALERVQKPQVVVERVEVPVLQPEQITQLRDLVTSLRAVADALRAALAKAQGQGSIRVQSAQAAPPNATASEPRTPVGRRDASLTTQGRDALQLRAGERRLLQTLAQRFPTTLTRAQLGTLAGFTPSGGMFGTYFGTLNRHGLLTEAAHGEVEITEAGLQYLGSDVPPKPQTTAEVLALWQRALRRGKWRMLETLVEVYPQPLTREALGERTGFTTTGETFGTYFGTLRRNRLIEVTGHQVRASQTLFLA
jgi:uncharacterized protein